MRACLVLLASCASVPTHTDAAALMALELVQARSVPVVAILDTETRELYVNGERSGRLGSCRQLPEGGRELTIYVARHASVDQLHRTIQHEVRHAALTCSEADH